MDEEKVRSRPEDLPSRFYVDCMLEERLEFVQEVLRRSCAQTGQRMDSSEARNGKREEQKQEIKEVYMKKRVSVYVYGMAKAQSPHTA